MGDADERKVLIPRFGARHNKNFSCNVGDDTEDSEPGAFFGTVRRCSGLRAGLLLLYALTLRPLASCFAVLRSRSDGRAPDNSPETAAVEAQEEVVAGRGMFVPPRARHGGLVPAPSDAKPLVAPQGSTAEVPLRTAAESGMEGLDAAAAAACEISRAIEGGRAPLRTVEQLAAVLEASAEFLPVRVEVTEVDTGDAASTSPHSIHCTTVRHICLEVLGPIRATPGATVVGVVEDILMEDCVPECLCITCIRFADIVFSGDATAAPSASRVGSNNHLDVFPSFRCSADVGDMMEENRESVAAFAKNMLECCVTLKTVHFTRCSFTPSDMGRGLRLPILRLRRLLFERCPLSAAHVDALVRLARAENRRSSGVRALGCLVELQLSGSLTAEAVDALLSYFHDDLLDSETSLLSLRLPSLWLRVARSHPLLMRQPLLVVTGT